MSGESPKNPSSTGFGPNEWLVDEIYQQYLSNKNSVDPSWWEFFGDYSPSERNATKIDNETKNLTPVVEPLTKKSIEEIVPIRVKAIEVPASNDAITETIRGTSARVVTNMEASLKVPTATSVRSVPAILLQENRTFINNHLARQRGGKVSSASKRADGIATKGKTKGTMVKMTKGGMAC
jgi:2-oxoglutarate dehydrogenase E1 component